MSGPLLWRRLLYSLIIIIVFEGLLRKLLPSFFSQVLFFAKDGICGLMLLLLLREGAIKSSEMIIKPWLLFTILLSPIVINTFTKAPVLAIFGSKQYVLFPIVAVAVIKAFPPNKLEHLRQFGHFLALLVLPTTAIALLQLGLPSGHWLNQGIGQSDLSGFSAGGMLRVSSTFAFVAQFSMFLNAMVFGLGLRYGLGKPQKIHVSLKAIPFAAFLMAYVISVFSTGSRTSVLGAVFIFSITGLLALTGSHARSAKKIIRVGLIAISCYFIDHWIKPEAFVAYEQRSSGDMNREIQGRFHHAFIGWKHGLRGAPPTFLGYGLGVMSNGSDKLSSYARDWRDRKVWGEADLPNTMFEGGWWLVLIWMGFRIYVILLCVTVCNRLRASKYHIAACAACGYIIIIGLSGSLGIQPPLSIWFWLAVGLVFTLERTHRWNLLAAKQLRDKQKSMVTASN